MTRFLPRFLKDRSGAALVEFAIALPLLLILFAVTVDGARMMWSYQKTAAGVRDATRFLGRAAPARICDAGGSVAGYQTQLEQIVRDAATTGQSIAIQGSNVLSVVPSHVCIDNGYRGGVVAIATVTASVRITLPFSTVFALIGTAPGTFTATVTDQTRIFGS